MLLTLLLQASWPAVHPLLSSLFVFLLTALGTWFWTTRSERRTARAKAEAAEEAAEKAQLEAVAAAARQAEADERDWAALLGRVDKLEATSRSFMPEGDIRDELHKLGKDIADNQAKIKTQHDRGEDVANNLNQRVATLEQHNTALTLLPSEVNNLKTDHRVLASKVDGLVNSVSSLDKKQDGHFRDLMEAVSNLSYTRGQLSRRKSADGE